MEKEQIYEEITKKAFAKAEKNYVNRKKYKLAESISENIEEVNKVRVTKKTFVNYYNKYIEKWENIPTPKHENIELLCIYLGYKSYKDYIQENNIKKGSLTEGPRNLIQPDRNPKTLKGKILLKTLWLFALVGVIWVSYSLLSPEHTNECMVWKTDHYEITECNGEREVITLDQETLKEMKQLMGLCKESTFFLPDDSPVVWYDKYHNKLTFFTMEGIHPTNGRTLKPITQYIIDKYVPECP